MPKDHIARPSEVGTYLVRELVEDKEAGAVYSLVEVFSVEGELWFHWLKSCRAWPMTEWRLGEWSRVDGILREVHDQEETTGGLDS